jgi:glucokinase
MQSFLLLLPSFIATAVFVYVFISVTFYVSISKWRTLKMDLSLQTPFYQNYVDLFSAPRFQADLRNTFIFTLIFIALTIGVGLFLAILLDHKVIGRAIFRNVFLFPYALSFVVTGVAWRWIFNIEMGLVDSENQIVARRRIPTNADDGPHSVVERIAQCAAELEHETGGGRIAALGICCPGPLDHAAGTLINPTNLPKFFNTPLRQMLAERLQIPAELEHDAKAAALGEFYYGAGRGARSMAYTVLGTGVGSAFIIDGQLYRGEHDASGEVGHTTLEPEGDVCVCGNRGCVQTFASGPFIARRYQRARPEIGAPISAEDVARLAAQGDPAAERIMREAGEAIGRAVAMMAMILDIDLYIFGGSVAKAGELLFRPAREALPQHAFSLVAERVRVVESPLGDDAPLLGCAWLARRAMEKA